MDSVSPITSEWIMIPICNTYHAVSHAAAQKAAHILTRMPITCRLRPIFTSSSSRSLPHSSSAGVCAAPLCLSSMPFIHCSMSACACACGRPACSFPSLCTWLGCWRYERAAWLRIVPRRPELRLCMDGSREMTAASRGGASSPLAHGNLNHDHRDTGTWCL